MASRFGAGRFPSLEVMERQPVGLPDTVLNDAASLSLGCV